MHIDKLGTILFVIILNKQVSILKNGKIILNPKSIKKIFLKNQFYIGGWIVLKIANKCLNTIFHTKNNKK